MSQRRRQNDTVTIVYPQGCREISEDLGSDELIRRLKSLAHTFQALGQAEDGSTYSEFAPLAIHLADDHYLNHESRDVQLLVACCVADILRIYAPEAPYKAPAQIKTIFYFLIKQLGGLRDPKDPAFKRYFYLLENLAYVKSFNMCFELEDFNEIFCALFSLIFKIVNDEHSSKVKTFMLDVLSPLITEADFVSNELLDIVLINIVEPYKTQRKNAYHLSKELIGKTSDTLAPYIQQFFNQVLILGKADVELNITNKVYDLIYELNNVSPSILLAVLPQLEFKLKSTEESERMGSVSLLARMFSEKGSDLATNHRPLWTAFLGRYNDISVAIRTKCVQYTMHFLINHPELQQDIVETLKARKHDSEENVRYEVVMAIVSTARRDFDIVSKSEDLLNFVKERTLDKKFKIRKEAMSGLAMIYKKHLSDPNNMHEATKKAVTWIKDKILHGYYMSGLEDRLLVERLLNMCLVPFNLESEERMKKLFLLFSTIDEYASKALIEVQKHQLHVRKAVMELLPLYRQPKSDKRDKEIQVKVHGLSKFLPEPMKAQEFLKRLSSNLVIDNKLLAAFEKVVDPDISCKECQVVVNQILKKMGSPIMTNLYYGTVKQLLERISSVMIDREAIQHLVENVKSALQAGSILNELNLEPAVAAERGLRLLYVLACVFPAHFEYTDILKELLGFLSIAGEHVGPLVLSCLTFVGRGKPMEDHFPDLLETLVPICKAFVRTGTPRQAKQAIKCLHTNVTATDTLDSVFGEILDSIKTNLSGPRGEAFLTAVVAAGHVAHLMPHKYPVHIKNIVSRNLVKQVMMQELSGQAQEAVGSNWTEFEDLGVETRCKFQAMKSIARWLTGLKNDALSARKTFRMLNAIIASKGNLLEDEKESQAGCAWLRLGAGCAMLKICEQKGVGDEYTVEQFYNLSLLVTDDVKEVRQLFIVKLQKGLSRGVPFKCLPLDFMGFYALVGFETDKKIKEMTKKYVIADITRRREYVKTSQLSGAASEQLPNIQPDYILLYAIAILTHFPAYESHRDVETLESMKAALWYIMEPLMMKTDSFFYGFYKQLIERMKNHTVASDPNSQPLNQKMWALCDLSHSLIMTKATNFELQEFPVAPSVSRLHFTPHPDADFVNQDTYIPTELMAATKAKTMYTVTQRKGAAVLVPVLSSEQQRPTEPENGKENEVMEEDENNGTSSSSSSEKRLRLDEQSGGDERPMATRRTVRNNKKN